MFKKNLAYVYFRRFSEKEGVLYFTRLFRFTLDGLIISQVVLTVFFGVTQQENVYIGINAALIPITVVVKVFGTRLWKSQVRALEDDEANAICGIDVEPSWIRIRRRNPSESGERDGTEPAPTDSQRRADGRFPTIVAPPASSSKIYRVIQHVTDAFQANGNERPSHLQEGSGTNVDALRIGANTLFKVPVHAVGQVGGKGKTIAAAYQLQKDLHRLNKIEKRKALESDAAEVDKPVDTITDRAHRGLHDSIRVLQASHLRHKKSIRGDEVTFLDGMDALTYHAPQGSADDGFHTDHDGELSLEEITLLKRSRSTRSQDMVQKEPTEPAIQESLQESPTESSEDHEKGEHLTGKASAGGIVEEGERLVCPHAGVIWEDHPNNEARYNNPFYNAVLDPFLWLPRMPRQTLDLCDTIEWYGPALVSSQGGKGNVGEWDDDEHTGDYEKHLLEEIDGEEAIVLPSTLARRLEDVEECDETADPAASLPKAVMADYKKAIGAEKENQSEVGSMRMSRLLRVTSRQSSHGGVTSPQASPALARPTTSPTAPGGGEPDAIPTLHLPSPSAEEGSAPAAMTTSGSVPGELRHKTSASHIAFAEGTLARYPSTRVPGGSHSRRVTNASYMSHGTAISAASGRSITMRQALQAEVLEEERRTTIGKRLAKKHAKEAERKKRKAKKDADEEALEVEDGAMNRQE